MSASEPILIGYFPKRIAMPPRPATPPHVAELCNAGRCGGLAPEGWVDLWLHNELWVYDTEARAWAVAVQTENLRRLRVELGKNWDGIPGSVEMGMDDFITRHIPPRGTFANPESAALRWDVFACRMFPTLYVDGEPQPIQFPPLKIQPLPADYERLGYDAVSHPGLGPGGEGYAKEFGHSSLSPFCNGKCQNIPVNRFCLLDTEEDGLRRAQEFSAGGGEPEPYVAVEVWRQRREVL
jgi:hypothetical protein